MVIAWEGRGEIISLNSVRKKNRFSNPQNGGGRRISCPSYDWTQRERRQDGEPFDEVIWVSSTGTHHPSSHLSRIGREREA